jgi:diguanylate cyclase (GGDEF)-like protein
VFGGSQPYTYGVFFVVAFVWVGIAHPRGTSLWLAPVAAVAYVVPILAVPGDHKTGLMSAFLTIPVSVLIGEMLAWVTGRLRQTAEAVEAKGRSLELMQDIAVAANEAPDVERAMQTCLDRICAHTGWPVGHVYFLDEGSAGTLVPSGIWHLDRGQERGWETFCRVTEAVRVGPGAGLPGRVFESGTPAWVADLAADPSFLNGDLAAELGVRASFAFPVLIGKEVVAVLEFFSDSPAEPDASLLDVMRHVGAQLGRVVERKRAADALRAEEVAHRALHDSLTGLPNLTLFSDRLGSALSRLRRRPGTVAVMFLDLDRFKQVNDALGHRAGDSVLREAAHRIAGCVRKADTLARHGGDEFVVVIPDVHQDGDCQVVAEKILRALEPPFRVDAREFTIGASIGVSLYPTDAGDGDGVLRNADAAMYRAKQLGRNNYRFYGR